MLTAQEWLKTRDDSVPTKCRLVVTNAMTREKLIKFGRASELAGINVDPIWPTNFAQ